jgi:hypothetical protein
LAAPPSAARWDAGCLSLVSHLELASKLRISSPFIRRIEARSARTTLDSGLPDAPSNRRFRPAGKTSPCARSARARIDNYSEETRMGPSEDLGEKLGVGFSVAPETVGAGCGQPAIGSSIEHEPSQGLSGKPLGGGFGVRDIGARISRFRVPAQVIGIAIAGV